MTRIWTIVSGTGAKLVIFDRRAPKESASFSKVQSDFALQFEKTAEEDSRRHNDRSASCLKGRIYGALNGFGIYCSSVGIRAEIEYVSGRRCFGVASTTERHHAANRGNCAKEKVSSPHFETSHS
jgi:hypothetical protein